MIWTYLLSYDPLTVSPEKLLREIDRLPEVVNWATPYRGAILLVSELDAAGLANILRRKTRLNGHRFLVVDTQTDRNGWLPKSAWSIMRNPTDVDE